MRNLVGVSVLKSSKGQAGIMQLILIIFILFIVIGVGMFYFYKFSISSVQQTAEDVCMQSTTEQLSSVLNMPEIKCSFQTVSKECVDIVKLISFIETGLNQKLGEGMCHKSVVFEKVYPLGYDEEIECDINNWRSDECGKWVVYEPADRIKERSTTVSILETPVSLYNPLTRKYTIGKLKLGLYQ